MAEVLVFGDGGYRFITAVFQYSGGVAAEPGFAIDRVRLRRLLPLEEGFRAIAGHLAAIGRPLAAFCACELRSPAPFSEAGFHEFNRRYIEPLEAWGIYRDGVNPVARTNACPIVDVPASPALYAFSYTVPEGGQAAPSFVIAGGGEAPEGKPNYRDHIVRRGDVSRDGMREKIRFVRTQMEARLRALGFSWQQALATQAYTIHDIGALVGDEIVRHAAAPGGLTWHFCRPPIIDLEFEMDLRAASRELVL